CFPSTQRGRSRSTRVRAPSPTRPRFLAITRADGRHLWNFSCSAEKRGKEGLGPSVAITPRMKRALLLTLAFGAAVGCTAADARQDGDKKDDPGTLGHASADLDAAIAFENLERVTQDRWVWIPHDTFRTPMHLSAARAGVPVLAAPSDAAKTTLGLLAAH